MIEEQIKSILSDFSFDDKNTFTKEIIHQLPGQSIIINGQQINQPGQTINLKLQVEIFGDGYVDDEEFTMLHFTIKQEDKVIRELFESFYNNEVDRFTLVTQQFFRI